MKILYVVPYVPSLVRVRPYNLIRSLQLRGHQVTVMTLWCNPHERAQADLFAQYCHEVQAENLPIWRSAWNCLLELPGSRPLQAVYSWQPDLSVAIESRLLNGKELQHYDILHVEHLRGVRYGLTARSLHTRIPVVWDSVDSISHLFRQAAQRSKKRISRWITQFELNRTERYEGWLLGQFDRILVTSPIDKQAFIELSSSKGEDHPISILPNGVDLEYFVPGQMSLREPASLVLSGKMSYHANVSMALEMVEKIMPLVWGKNPAVKLLIVGKDPPGEIQALGEHPNIEVTGTVEDLRPYLQRASIAVAPLSYGAGIQNKILEGMACSTPVITSPLGASALQARPGEELIVAEDAIAFADRILELLKDRDRRVGIGEAGRRYVEKHHQWGEVARQLEGIYHEVIFTRRGVLSE